MVEAASQKFVLASYPSVAAAVAVAGVDTTLHSLQFLCLPAILALQPFQHFLRLLVHKSGFGWKQASLSGCNQVFADGRSV